MWGTVGQYLLKAAIWCLQNPDAVNNGLGEIHTLVDVIHAKKQQPVSK
jgi:hypothetical protein